MPKMSFIVPVYNSQDYLERCINSIINQSEADIEIICVNDGSVDNSLEILNKFSAKDSRIKLISRENRGAGASRNDGIKAATGEYIAFVDSDDYIEKDFAKLCYDCAINNNAQSVHINNIEYWPNGAISHIDTLEEYKKRGGSENLKYNTFINYKEFRNSLMIFDQAPWKRIYERSFLISNNIFFPETIRPQGEDLPFSLAIKINADVFYLDKILYHHNVRSDSISQNINNRFPIKEIIEACNVVKKQFDERYAENQVGINEAFDTGIVSYCLYANYLNRNKENYISEIKPCLTETQYMKFVKEIIKADLKQELKMDLLKELKVTPSKLIQTIFSVKNEFLNSKKYKVLTIAGIKFKMMLNRNLKEMEN